MGNWKLAICSRGGAGMGRAGRGAEQGHAVGRPAGRRRDARPACAVGHRQLHDLPQHLRQPADARRRRQDRAADRRVVALRQRHGDRLRDPHRREIPRRLGAHAGGRRVQRQAHHQSGVQEPAARPVQQHRRRPRSPDPRTVRLTTKEPYPALLAQLVKLSIVPKRYVESVGDVKFNLEPMGSGPYRLVELAEGRARRARGERELLARQAGDQARHLPAGAGRRDPHRRPAHRQGRHHARPELGRHRGASRTTRSCRSCRSRPSGSATCSSTRCGGRPRTCACAAPSPTRSTAA